MTTSKWFITAKKADFYKIGEKYKINPVLARIIRNRDIITDEEIEQYLYGSLDKLHDPYLLYGMREAISLIKEKINNKKKIRIIGDYDVDGICATFILKKGLEMCGACVDTVIPHRIKDGYGINEQLISEAKQDGVDTVITCDNGIAAMEPVRLAKELNMTCIITDHHEVPFEETEEGKRFLIPQADVVIDPKQECCTYPFKKICGAVVAWKLIMSLLQEYCVNQEQGNQLLELAGFATICDVMELRDENRIIVKESLKSMAHTKNYGLAALMKVHEIKPENLSSYHIGFVLGPCFNATGRLDTAALTLELLDCENEREAILAAVHLKELNESRKELTDQGVVRAMELVEENHYEKDKVIVLYLPECHESLAGIIAGRIRERYCRPTFILTEGEEGAKGSGRSIDSYHMYEEMTKCKHLFSRYGGHKLAAGLSMEKENIPVFRRVINENCTLQEEDFVEKIHIDIELPLAFVTREFISELNYLEPFGMGNTKPVFAKRNLAFLSMRIMGRNKDMAKFIVSDEEGNRFQMVLFRQLELFLEAVEEKYGKEELEKLAANNRGLGDKIKMDIIYYPGINSYMGKEEIQFVIQEWK